MRIGDTPHHGIAPGGCKAVLEQARFRRALEWTVSQVTGCSKTPGVWTACSSTTATTRRTSGCAARDRTLGVDRAEVGPQLWLVGSGEVPGRAWRQHGPLEGGRVGVSSPTSGIRR